MDAKMSPAKTSGRLGVFAAVVLVLVAGAVVYGLSTRAPRMASAPGKSARDDAPRCRVTGPADAVAPLGASRELLQMKDELARLRAEVGGLRAEAARAAPAPTPEPFEPPSRGEQEAQFLTYMADVDQRFRNEPRDHDWADQAPGYIREAAASKLVPAGLVGDVDCRSRTCKVELAPLDAPVLGKGIDLMIAELAQVLPNARTGHDGELKNPKPNAIYFTRASPEDSPAVARQ